MPDDSIIQRMGFDCGPAIATINSLKTALDGLNTVLATTGKEIRSWNTGGKGASKAFDSMQKSAAGLLSQFDAIAKAQANISAGTRGGATLSTGGIESQLNLIQQLTGAWGTLPATASAGTRQAFAQGQANLAQFATANKMTAQQVVQSFTTMGTGAKGVVGQMGTQFTKLSNTHKAAAAQINNGNQSMTVSFGTLVKIMQFRMAISAITALTQKLREGVTAGADFSRQLGMIQTVAGEGANISKISAQLEELSRQFASPLIETASGYYLILQNQVGGADNALKVLTESMKLHVATGATVKEAADTLTVAINGMGLGFENTEDVSGKLFKAVEIGRFEFKEMGNVLGMLGPLTRELGVGFEEVLGPIATMTRSGVSFTKAVTQMRAILSQTLKPTEALKKIFKGWGVEDAEQAISKFGGLLPMLKALEEATHGNTSELAQAFTNLRALSGSVSILGKNYQDAVRDTNQIAAATGDLTNKVAGMVQATEGMKFDTAINKINISFAQLGKTALPLLNDLLAALQYLMDGLARLSEFKDWIKGLRGAPVEAEKLIKELTKIQKKYEEEVLTGNLIIQDARIAANKKVVEATNAGLSKLQLAHTKSTDKIIDTNKNMVGTLKGELERLIALQTKLVTKYSELADEDGTKMQAAVSKRNQTAMAASDKAFSFQVDNLNNVRKSIEQTKRSQDSMNMAMSKARLAQSPEDYAEVDRLLQRAASYAGEASSSAGTEYANRVRLYQARQQEMAVANAMTDVDNARIATLAADTATARANLKLETAKLNTMKEYVKTIIEATSLSTGTGDQRRIKTGEEIAKDAALGETAWTNLINLMSSTKGVDIAAMLDLGDLRQKLDARIKGLPALKAQVEFNYKPQLLALAADGEKVRARFGEPFMIKYNIDPTNPFKGLMEAQKKLLDEQEQLKPGAAAYQAEIDSLRGLVTARLGASSKLDAVIEKEKTLIKGSSSLLGEGYRLDLTETATAYKNMLVTMQALGRVNPNNITAFNAALQQASESKAKFEKAAAQGGVGTGFTIDPNVLKAIDDTYNTVLSRFRQAQEMPGKELAQQIQGITQQLNNIRAQTATLFPAQPVKLLALGTSVAEVNTLISSTGTIKLNAEGTATAWKDTNSQLREAINLQNQLKSPSASAPVAQAKGGYMRFATGGKAHGTDTIPAMLSPGEFVVNARSTRQFFSQLVAMNAGVKPIYRQDGGAVTNIGDINVTVPGGSTTRQTAREIATALRREVRRGTSKL
jgi:TP901 family phage tail tape measure protein